MMKRNILVVDDDASVRNSLKKLLQAEGYHVLTGRDSSEALDLFQSEEIHLVVMDINLGDEDGWETFARMAESNRAVPTIIATAEFGQRDRAIAAGVEALVEKPMDVGLFLEIVEKLLTKSRRPKRNGEDEPYCLFVNRGSDSIRRDLENRSETPLDMTWFDRLRLVPTAGDDR